MTRDRKPAGIGSLAPNQLLILNGVNTNSMLLQNGLTNFLILSCVVMEKDRNVKEGFVQFLTIT